MGFLLTKNTKDFIHDKKLTFNRVHGIISIEGDMSNIIDYGNALANLDTIIKFGEIYHGMKIKLSPNEISA
jgi:hypothetical protein